MRNLLNLTVLVALAVGALYVCELARADGPVLSPRPGLAQTQPVTVKAAADAGYDIPTMSIAYGPCAEYPDAGSANSTAAPAASGSAAVTGLAPGTLYWLTCDQPFRFRQGAGSFSALSTDFGPVAANTIIHVRLATGKTAIAFYNLGATTANCSVSADVP